MRVLITGGAGFIGSHLCDSLVAACNEVSILDNLSTGSERNIAHLKGKIKVNVLIFGRPTSVELEDTQVRK